MPCGGRQVLAKGRWLPVNGKVVEGGICHGIAHDYVVSSGLIHESFMWSDNDYKRGRHYRASILRESAMNAMKIPVIYLLIPASQGFERRGIMAHGNTFVKLY